MKEEPKFAPNNHTFILFYLESTISTDMSQIESFPLSFPPKASAFDMNLKMNLWLLVVTMEWNSFGPLKIVLSYLVRKNNRNCWRSKWRACHMRQVQYFLFRWRPMVNTKAKVLGVTNAYFNKITQRWIFRLLSCSFNEKTFLNLRKIKLIALLWFLQNRRTFCNCW